MTDPESDDEKVESFVVRNAAYYRDRWTRFHEKPGSFLSFNWAACLLGPLWLAYRKLYVPTLLSVVVLVADVALWLYVEDRQLLSENLSTLWGWIVAVLWVGVFGFLGNYWYWGRFRNVEQQATARHTDRNGQLQYLRFEGGTSPVVAWAMVVVILAPILWGGYWAYQGYRAGVVLDATGPLTLHEIQANFLSFMDEPLTGMRQECVHREIEERASAAGDPESLNPETVELLRADGWDRLDAQDKRFELGEAIFTKALLDCIRPEKRNPGNSATSSAGAGTFERLRSALNAQTRYPRLNAGREEPRHA